MPMRSAAARSFVAKYFPLERHTYMESLCCQRGISFLRAADPPVLAALLPPLYYYYYYYQHSLQV